MNGPQRARIRAREFWNDTGINLVAGQRYRFEATGKWTDFLKKTDANGFRSEEVPIFGGTMKKHEPDRRQPNENWFALIGAIDQDDTTAFRIGALVTLVATRTGQLTCYANDKPGYYWNNRGAVELTVTTLP